MRIIAGLAALALLAGCSSATVKHEVQSAKEVVHTMPIGSHLAWCRGNDPGGCFDEASAMCSPDSLDGALATQHPKPGPWHEIAETDMAFPAMVQDHDGWRMWFVCGDAEATTR